jgi:ankyrin repeat protein
MNFFKEINNFVKSALELMNISFCCFILLLLAGDLKAAALQALFESATKQSETVPDSAAVESLRDAMLAGRRRDFDQVLEQRPNLKIAFESKENCLHVATSTGKLHFVNSLLSRCGDDDFVNAQTKTGQTALHIAVTLGHMFLVDVLVDAGARLEIRDINGDTPLIAAVLANNADISKRLIMRAANVNAQNRDGMTALHLAASSGNHDTVGDILKLAIPSPHAMHVEAAARLAAPYPFVVELFQKEAL